MTTAPTPLPGMPEPEPPSADFDEWLATVRPIFEKVAATGRPFLCWTVAKEYELPEPPNPKQDWATLIKALHHDGFIYQDGFGNARDQSAVKKWRGTRAARKQVAA